MKKKMRIRKDELVIFFVVFFFLGAFVVGGFFIEPDFCQDVDGCWSGFTEEEHKEMWKEDCERFGTGSGGSHYDYNSGEWVDTWYCSSCRKQFYVEQFSYVFSCPYCFSSRVTKLDD